MGIKARITAKEEAAGIVSNLLCDVEAKILNGLDHPWGRAFEVTEVVDKNSFAAVRLVKAYCSLKENKIELPDLFRRIYYLARCVVGCERIDRDIYFLQAGRVDEGEIKALCDIANEGRILENTNDLSVEDRIKAQRLFEEGLRVSAAQYQTPKKGCSASICSNCYEPVAFCDKLCVNCHYPFIELTSTFEPDEGAEGDSFLQFITATHAML